VPHVQFMLESCWPGMKLVFIPELLQYIEDMMVQSKSGLHRKFI